MRVQQSKTHTKAYEQAQLLTPVFLYT